MRKAYVDYDRNFLFGKICTRLKEIIWYKKRNPSWDLEKLCAYRQKKNSAIERESGNVKL